MGRKNDGYEPTEEEAEVIDRAGLSAAWQALQPLNDVNLEISTSGVLACLRAFKAASSAAHEAKKALAFAHPGKYIRHFPDETAMVCSALFGLDENPADVNPSSIGGARIVCLLKACRALEAMSLVHSAFDDGDEVFGTIYAEKTIMVAEEYGIYRPG